MNNSQKKRVIIKVQIKGGNQLTIKLMGGSSSTTTRTVYQDNPHTINALNSVKSALSSLQAHNSQLNRQLSILRESHYAQLRQLSESYQKQLRQLNFLSDPSKIQEAEEKLFNNFVSNLKSFNIINPIPKENNYRYTAIIGENSAGKSSMFNWVLGTKLQVGVDDTTLSIATVSSDASRKIVYFDSPGLNQTFNITHAEYLKAFYTVDFMFIATSVTFKNSIKTIQVMNKINPPKLYLVRNQCDKFQNQNDLKKARDRDYDLLKQFDITNVKKILYVSTRKGDDFLDNALFKRLMRGIE